MRPPAVAGTFYPAEPRRLGRDVDAMLDPVRAGSSRPPKALVVPHAGYVYSGPIAASAYGQLKVDSPPRRVVLLGPAHYVAFRGLALPEATAFATPLGPVPLDEPAMARAAALPQVSVSALAHAREHSLEVQLPFLQRVLGELSLVPLAVGRATADEVAQVLETLSGGQETLLVISTDLSHYLPYDEAAALDGQTVERIIELDHQGLEPDQACGVVGLCGLLLFAQRHALSARALDVRSSGDTAGDRSRVVGYASLRFDSREAS